MMVTDSGLIGDRMLTIFCYVSDLSVSETCHRHILSQKPVTNVDVTATKRQNLAKTVTGS